MCAKTDDECERIRAGEERRGLIHIPKTGSIALIYKGDWNRGERGGGFECSVVLILVA